LLGGGRKFVKLQEKSFASGDSGRKGGIRAQIRLGHPQFRKEYALRLRTGGESSSRRGGKG